MPLPANSLSDSLYPSFIIAHVSHSFDATLFSRLRERELQLQSDLTTASREINRLRVNIKQAGSNSTSRAGEEANRSRPTPLSSASIAALSLRSPPEERDRQH